MRVRFDLEDLLAENAHFELLARIIHRIEDGWHDWSGPDPDDNALESYFTRHPTHAELIAKSYTRSLAYPDATSKEIVVSNCAGASFDLKKATIYLGQALQILVENRINDGEFLRAVLRVVDPDLVDLIDTPDAPLQFEHGGGKAEILKLLRDRVARSDATSIPPRLVILVDSDSKFPGHVTAETRQLLDQGEYSDVPVLVLEKRSIENYIPDRTLEHYAARSPDVRTAVEFIISLESAQRDHYPIKFGLRPYGAAEPPVTPRSEQEDQLYQNVSFPVLPVAKLPRLVEFFLKHWESSMTAADLSARNCLGEAYRITARVRKEL